MMDLDPPPLVTLNHTEFDDLRERQIAMLGSWSQIGHVIYVLGELGVADLVADHPRTVADLALRTETDASALRRVLRCAAAVGIFAELDDGRYGLTPLAEGLLSDRVGGLRPIVRMSGMEVIRLAYAQILHSVRTGKPAFDLVFGMPFHAYLGRHPELARFYEGFLAHFSRRLADRFVDRIDPSRFRRIADIGAGTGYFLARMLAQQPNATGILFDTPPVADGAFEVLVAHGVADRATVVAGDLFRDDLPAGCDLYTLKSVLHRWRDEQAVTLLARIRAAMGDVDGRVIAIDQIVPAHNAWDHSKALDIDTLVLYGGIERELGEWRKVADAAGFELCNQPGERGWSMLEFRPLR